MIKHESNYLLNEQVKRFSLVPRLLSKSFHPEYGAWFHQLDSESNKSLTVLTNCNLLIKMKANKSHVERRNVNALLPPIFIQKSYGLHLILVKTLLTWFYYNQTLSLALFVSLNWLHVRSNLASGLANDRFLGKQLFAGLERVDIDKQGLFLQWQFCLAPISYH